MTFTYDLTIPYSPITLVRLRINDKHADDPIFVDEEIGAFLYLEANNVKCAAALALETIAADEVLVQKVIKLLALSTDGAKVAAELRANATALRKQAADEATSDPNDPGFDVGEWPVNVFSDREIWLNRHRRSDG